VLDEKDKCPLVKGSPANNGCPDNDKDGDTVLDRLDACIDVKGVPENKGCPDVDTDEDGSVDRLDACKTDKGPADNKGCPYPDTDKDGLADNLDNCINEAGPLENRGCPVAVKQLVEITTEKLVIKDKVYFDTDKATIQARSNKMLDQIVSILNQHKEITLVQIEGHTDNTGDAARNRQLSADRAKSVVDYLVKKGIAAERLKPVGFGPDRPADDNSTAKGKENNRRVEFNIISHGS
jgi:OmpA-OmpF porin, OOP family